MTNLRPQILKLPQVVGRAKSSQHPLVSVITPNYNHAHYLEDTLIGVNRQTYPNLEHIVIDGGSTDNSISIIQNYPDVNWISEKDRGMWDGYFKGLRISKAKYILTCFSSDMFIDPNWVQNCVDAMEDDSKISMIWGGVATANVSGELIESHSWPTHMQDIPSEKDMFFYWLATSVNLPETNYCVPREVMLSLISEEDLSENEFESDQDIALLFQYRFHSEGYMSKYLPFTPNFVRKHEDQRTVAWNSTGLFGIKMATYAQWHRQFRRSLLLGKSQHFRASDGSILETYGWFKIVYFTFFQKLRIVMKGQI